MKDRLKISLMIDRIPSKQDTERAATCKPSIEEEVRHAVTLCESNHDSRMEWEFITRVYNHLAKKPDLSERQKNLFRMIEPVLKRHESANPSQINYDVEKSLKAGSLFKL